MPQTLNDFNTAVRLHQLITRIIRRELNKIRPLPRYGVVTTAFNPMTQKVQVRIGRDAVAVPVTCSTFMMPTLGSYIRIDGPDSDLFCTHVIKGGLEASVTTTFFGIMEGGSYAAANVGVATIEDGGAAAGAVSTSIVDGGPTA